HLRELRRVRAGLSEQGDRAWRGHLRNRAAALHRVCRALRCAAVRRGLPGRVHHRRSATYRDAGATARALWRVDRRGRKVKKYILWTWLLALAWSPAPATAAEAAPKPGHAAIASAHKLATQAGFEVLAQGGNAFDAAVAVASTLSVVEPQSSGIGGGGFFLLHRASDGKNVMLDARETAPSGSSSKLYEDANGNPDRDKSLNGALAAGIP